MAGSTISPTATPAPAVRRRLPIGAEPTGDGRTHVRVWAPVARALDFVSGRQVAPLGREDGGYFSGLVEAGAGARYRFRIDGGDDTYPDPASRFQPEGPDGDSEIVDARSFEWSDLAWPGVS